jgi:thiol-disulfide isomerase/thioredoxin
MFEKKRLLIGVVAAIVLIAIGFVSGYYAHMPIARGIRQYKQARAFRIEHRNLTEKFLNKQAPAITAETLDGEPWSLQEQQEKVVLVFFWATFCKYSRAAVPDMKSIYDNYNERADFEMIGVSLDTDRDELVSYSAEKGIPWTNLYEDGKGWDNSVSRALDVHSIPSVWIIDRGGIIRGFRLNREEIETTLAALFNGKTVDKDELSIKTLKKKAKKQPSGCTN